MDNVFQTYFSKIVKIACDMTCSVARRAYRVRWRLCVCVGQTDALSDVDWSEGSGQCTGHRPPCGDVSVILYWSWLTLCFIAFVSLTSCRMFFWVHPSLSTHKSVGYLMVPWLGQRAFTVFRPSTWNKLLHLCHRWTWQCNRFGANWRRTCSSSNCSSTSATLTGTAVAGTVSAAPNIKLSHFHVLQNGCLFWHSGSSVWHCRST